jgi:hypothetical protein
MAAVWGVSFIQVPGTGFGSPVSLHLSPSTDTGFSQPDGIMDISNPAILGNAAPLQ